MSEQQDPPLDLYPPGSQPLLSSEPIGDHTPLGYIVLVVCSCGKRHATSPAQTIVL